MNQAIDWRFAEAVAARCTGREPFVDAALRAELEASYARLTAEAEGHVAAETGLPQLAGPARARVTDRDGWVRANVHSFRRLLRPLTERLEAERDGHGAWRAVGRKATGAELGALLGWMSTRVLGQYDLLIIDDERPEEQDVVYYVGPNLLTLERRYAFPPEQFRLWVALHECTHRAQFTGVPWLRHYFLEQVHELVGSIDPDADHLLDTLKRVMAERRAGEKVLDRGGLAAAFATPQQRLVLDRIGGLMSLLEGHGEVVMNRAAAGRVPAAWRFEKVLKDRRRSAGAVSRLLYRLVGFEAKMNQYAEGESFIHAVERIGGRAAFDQVWQGPQWLPTLAEIRAPQQWLDRVDTLTTSA
ncbi:MAG: zinc-dependent metalloprotease [Acidimicrobiia bacterium]